MDLLFIFLHEESEQQSESKHIDLIKIKTAEIQITQNEASVFQKVKTKIKAAKRGIHQGLLFFILHLLFSF